MADFGKVSDSFVKSNQSKKLQPLVSLLAKHVRMIIFFVPWLPRLRRTIQIKPKIIFSDCVLLVEKYWFLHLPGKWNVTSFLAGDNNPLWWCIRKCETVKTNMWSYLWWWPRMAGEQPEVALSDDFDLSSLMWPSGECFSTWEESPGSKSELWTSCCLSWLRALSKRDS